MTLSLRSRWNSWHITKEEGSVCMDILTAASVGNHCYVRGILKCSASNTLVNSRNKSCWTALLYAACWGHYDLLELLLHRGATVNAKNCQGQTAVILAAMYANHCCVQRLLKFNADTEVRDCQDRTALFHAAAYGHAGILQELLRKGAKFNYVEKFSGLSPLTVAAVNQCGDIVQVLLNAGAQFDESPQTEQCGTLSTWHSQVMYAAENGNIETLEQFLSYNGLSKYFPLFEEKGIDLDQFLKLTSSDLEDIGVKLVGPRVRMVAAIAARHAQ